MSSAAAAPPTSPDLPIAAHTDVDSMLSRKFGREIANYFSGSPLNRLSFMRADTKFLSDAFLHPSTHFLLLRDLAPLAHSPKSLAWVTRADVTSLIGEQSPYTHTEEETNAAYDSRQTIPAQLVFLGIDESQRPEPEPFTWKIYKGRPYFALDVTPRGPSKDAAEALIAAQTGAGTGKTFLEGRTHMNLPAPEAAIYAEARSVTDWNGRNPFCGGCGGRTLSVHAGFKRLCPAADAALRSAADAAGARPACATRGRVSNLSFPRTDPTIIVAVLSADGARLLLGRQRSWPKYWYSTLAGFVEPAESVEEAVRREVWEEAGIALGRVQVHSTQPWPYPASLMIGCVAQALAHGETISLEYDPELKDARWWTMAEVREALQHGVGGLDDMARSAAGYTEGNLRLPPKTAIANQLIEAVVNGGFAGSVGKL